MPNHKRFAAVACMFTAVGLTSCAPAPGGVVTSPRGTPVQTTERGRALKAGDVGEGAGTLEGVRRQLEGTWTLASLEVVNAAGTATPVTAGGTMTYDAYGNFDLRIQLDPEAARSLGANAAALDLQGRAVIDVANQSFRVVDVDAAGAAPRPENVSRVRHYAFQGDRLTLTVKDASGQVTATSTWRRQP